MKKIFFISDFKIPVEILGSKISYEVAIVRVWLHNIGVPPAELTAFLSGLGIESATQAMTASQLDRVLQFFFSEKDYLLFLQHLHDNVETKIRAVLKGELAERKSGLLANVRFRRAVKAHCGDLAVSTEYLLYGLFGARVETIRQTCGKTLRAVLRKADENDYIDLLRAEKLARQLIRKDGLIGKIPVAQACLSAGQQIAELSALEDIERYGKIKEGSNLQRIMQKIVA